jgi:hypothetical protein
MLDDVVTSLISGAILDGYSRVLDAAKGRSEPTDLFLRYAPELRDLTTKNISRRLESEVMQQNEFSNSQDQLLSYFLSRDFDIAISSHIRAYLRGAVDSVAEYLRDQIRMGLQLQGLSSSLASLAAAMIGRIVVDESAAAIPIADVDALAEVQARGLRSARLSAEEVESPRLLNILASMKDLLDSDSVTLDRLDAKVSELRSAISRLSGTLSPPHLTIQTQDLPIEQLYVSPQIAATVPTLHYSETDLHPSSQLVDETFDVKTELGSLVNRNKRLVLLGNPGAGKSTLVQYIAYRAAQEQIGGLALAFPLILLDFAEEIARDRGLQIDAAVAFVSRVKYQVPLTVAEARFLLATGRMLLLVDGLDELDSRRTRTYLRDAVDAFSAVNDLARVWVTSRKLGYRQSTLSGSVFREATILDFDPVRVELYARNWFSSSRPMSQPEIEQLTDAFLDESLRIEELRSNPLILALLCDVYANAGYIPQNRAAVYQACADLLFKKWDEYHNLYPSFDFEGNIDGTLQDLALWISNDVKLLMGVSRSGLIDRAAIFLDRVQYQNRQLAEMAARRFVDFCSGRAWIFSDVGTADDGIERLFGFTHRTFREWYCAKGLVNNLDHDSLKSFVGSNSFDDRWAITCELAIQIAFSSRRGLESDLVDEVTRRFSSATPTQRTVGLWVLKESLGGKPLRPSTTLEAGQALLNAFIYRARNAHRNAAPSELRDYWIDSEKVAFENLPSLDSLIRGKLEPVQLGSEGNAKRIALLADFALRPRITPEEASGFTRPEDREWLVAQTLTGTDVDSLIMWRLLFGFIDGGDAIDACIRAAPRLFSAPVRAPWNLRLKLGPSVAETIVWRCIYSKGADESALRLISGILAPSLTKPQPSLLRDFSAWVPHWLFTSSYKDMEVTDQLEPAEHEDLFRLVVAMCDAFVEVPDEREKRRRVIRLLAKNWGSADVMRLCVHKRYGQETYSGHALSRAPEWLQGWTAGVDIRAEA